MTVTHLSGAAAAAVSPACGLVFVGVTANDQPRLSDSWGRG
jgi:hypothetical protein